MSATSTPDYKVKKKIFQIEVGDQVYEVRKPNYQEHKAIVKRIKESGDDGDAGMDATLQCLIKLGMPEEASTLLDLDDIVEISKIVMGTKKNSDQKS